jgi:hypothetical protein
MFDVGRSMFDVGRSMFDVHLFLFRLNWSLFQASGWADFEVTLFERAFTAACRG